MKQANVIHDSFVLRSNVSTGETFFFSCIKCHNCRQYALPFPLREQEWENPMNWNTCKVAQANKHCISAINVSMDIKFIDLSERWVSFHTFSYFLYSVLLLLHIRSWVFTIPSYLFEPTSFVTSLFVASFLREPPECCTRPVFPNASRLREGQEKLCKLGPRARPYFYSVSACYIAIRNSAKVNAIFQNLKN